MRYKEASLGWEGGISWNRVSELYIDYSYSMIVPHTHLVIRSPLSLCNIYICALSNANDEVLCEDLHTWKI